MLEKKLINALESPFPTCTCCQLLRPHNTLVAGHHMVKACIAYWFAEDWNYLSLCNNATSSPQPSF